MFFEIWSVEGTGSQGSLREDEIENEEIVYYLEKFESNEEEELKTSHTELSWIVINQAENHLKQTSWNAEVVVMNEADQEIELDNFEIEKNTQEEAKTNNPRKESRHTD